MAPPVRVATIDAASLDLTIEAVGRCAGGGDYQVAPAMQAVVEAARQDALGLAAPAFTHCIYPVRHRRSDGSCRIRDGLWLPGGRSTDPGMDRIAAAVVTLGPALEAEVARRHKAGDMLGGLFLDAAGVALLDLAAREVVVGRIARDDTLAGYVPCCYRQPGCEAVPMDAQTVLFQLVDAGAVNVVLTASLVMRPAKSLSFWVEWSRRADAERAMDKCANCSLRQCMFRRRSPRSPG